VIEKLPTALPEEYAKSGPGAGDGRKNGYACCSGQPPE